MVLSHAAVANRLTPTGIAEATYQARGRKTWTGADGIVLPIDREVYRVSDADLLGRVCVAAVAAYGRRLDVEHHTRAAAVIVSEYLCGLYPPAKMSVLEEFGYARRFDYVTFDLPAKFALRLHLAAPIVLPAEKCRHFNIDGRNSNHAFPVAAQPHVAVLNQVESERVEHEVHARSWPAKMKREMGRYPRWAEIYAAWPVIAKWIAEQREIQPNTGAR